METLSQYKHPSIVQLIVYETEYAPKPESVFLLLEYCSGGDLEQLAEQYDKRESRFEEFEL